MNKDALQPRSQDGYVVDTHTATEKYSSPILVTKRWAEADHGVQASSQRASLPIG